MSFIGRFFLLVLFLSFGELYLLVLVAEKISLLTTLALCVLTGILGGAMVRHQGLQTLRDIQKATAQGNAPAVEIVSGLILLVIGAFLLTPGFITDTVAFLMLTPPIRKAVATAVVKVFKSQVQVVGGDGFQGGFNMGGFPQNQNHQNTPPEQTIIEVEAEDVSPKS